MAAIDQIAKEYADYLHLNKHNPLAVDEIANRINGLVYTETGTGISKQDKEKILAEIQRILSMPKRTKDGRMIKEAEDSRALIRLVQMIRTKVGG